MKILLVISPAGLAFALGLVVPDIDQQVEGSCSTGPI